MTKKEKVFKKLKENPEKISFLEICKIIEWIRGEVVDGEGSYVVFKYENEILLTIPKYNNDCKSFYKKQISKILISKNLLS